MSLLAIIAAHAAAGPGPDPDPDPQPAGDPLPGVTWPTSSPFNSPLPPCTIPTSDGSGETIHPSVVDMGSNPVSGYRFWMANTPYPNQDITLENPEIYASHDGQTWVTPAGVTNPLYGYPSISGGYWSDTDLSWDPDGERFILIYRDSSNEIYVSTSPDGITWPATPTFLAWAVVSPSLVRTPEGTWRLYYQQSGAKFKEATDPLGPYGPEIVCNGGVGGWHAHVIYDDVLGKYLAVSGNGVFTARSTDGITWSGRGPYIDGQTYRPCMRRFDATTFHVWYSTGSTPTTTTQLTHYTRMPQYLWQ